MPAGIPRVDVLARALLGWATWFLLPVFMYHATGDPPAAALAAAGSAVMLFLHYRLSPEPARPALGSMKPFEAQPGTLTVPLEEARPLRPARDLTDDAPTERAGRGEIPLSDSARLAFSIASAPAFVAVGYLQQGSPGADWASALFYCGLASIALFAIVAPVSAFVSRSNAERSAGAKGWGPAVPLTVGALLAALAFFFPGALYFLGSAAVALLLLALIVQDYKDAWNSTGRHRRRW